MREMAIKNNVLGYVFGDVRIYHNKQHCMWKSIQKLHNIIKGFGTMSLFYSAFCLINVFEIKIFKKSVIV